MKSKRATIDGVDFTSMTIVKKINVFKSYQDRSAGVLYKVKHKEKIELIKIFKEGYVEIRKRRHKESGFVNALFIKEIKYFKPTGKADVKK
jgi:hypothetical protein